MWFFSIIIFYILHIQLFKFFKHTKNIIIIIAICKKFKMAARLQKIVETLKEKNDGLMIEVGSLYNLIINKLNLFVKILLILF